MNFCDVVMMPSQFFGEKHRAQHSPLEILMKPKWSQFPLKHCWNFGYHSYYVMKIINSLPWRVWLSLNRLSQTLHCISDDSSFRLKNLYLATRYQFEKKENVVEMPQITESWDEDNTYGLIQMEFDPEFQTRLTIALNKRASYFWQLSKEDLVHRFLQNEVPLQMTELDWIRAFSAYVGGFFESPVVQYLRFTLGVGDVADATLVCMTTFKSFNQFGRIIKVRLAQPRTLHLSSYSPT